MVFRTGDLELDLGFPVPVARLTEPDFVVFQPGDQIYPGSSF